MVHTHKVDTNFGLSAQSLAILHLLCRHEFCTEKVFWLNTAPFYNGRERGVIVYITRRNETFHIWWAENRNSDDIVVYKWVAADSYLNPPTLDNMPDSAWKDGAFFGYDKTAQAADYIKTEIDNYLITKDTESEKG